MSHFNAKMHQIQFQLGLCPRPHWKVYSAPRPLSFYGREEKRGKGGTGGERGPQGLVHTPMFEIMKNTLEAIRWRVSLYTCLSVRRMTRLGLLEKSLTVFMKCRGEVGYAVVQATIDLILVHLIDL